MITLPWPPAALSPNTRGHFHAKAKIAKAYRNHAYWLAKIDPLPFPADGEVLLKLEFYPPDKRRRDLDGMLSSIKAGLDGLADAHEVNDYRFALNIRRCEPVTGGKVVVSL